MPLTPEEARDGKCGSEKTVCDKRAVLKLRFEKPDGTYEYEGFCKDHLDEAGIYVQEKNHRIPA